MPAVALAGAGRAADGLLRAPYASAAAVTAFWSAAGKPLAERLVAATGPSLVFWMAALGVCSLDPRRRDVLTRVLGPLSAVTVGALTGVVVAIVAVTASVLVVDRLVEPATALLLGRWPRILASCKAMLVAGIDRRRMKAGAEWQDLREREPSDPRIAEIEAVRRRLPADRSELCPTRCGNILRAAELLPAEKYGLDAVTAWPRLWLVLPAHTRQELVAARAAFDATVAAVLWSLLFTAIALVEPWWGLVGPLTAALVVRLWLPARARTFADLYEAAFDVHRDSLYRALRWPSPRNPADEHATGRAVSAYLLRGSDDRYPQFVPSPVEAR